MSCDVLKTSRGLARLSRYYSHNSQRKFQHDVKMYQNFITLYLYEAQHVLGDTPPIIRSLKLHWKRLVFRTWKAVGRAVGGRCQAHTVPDSLTTSTNYTSNNLPCMKIRACQCSFRLMMMGGVSPETCWALCKYGIIKFWYIFASCWNFLYELYYDALWCITMHGLTNVKFIHIFLF